MFNVGDQIRVIRGIGQVLPVGMEGVLEDNQPRNRAQYVRFRNNHGVPTVYLADRFELVAPAIVDVPVAEPHQFQVGDVVRIVARNDDAGWMEAMDDYINNGVEYTINRIIGPRRTWAKMEEDDRWHWPLECLELVRVAGVAEPVRAAIIPPAAPVAPDPVPVFRKDDVLVCIDAAGADRLTPNKEYVALSDATTRGNPTVRVIDDHGEATGFYTRRFNLAVAVAPAPKQGPIAREDVVPGMQAIFVGGGTAPHILDGYCNVGDVVVVVGHYGGGIPDAWSIKVAGREADLGCYRDNFHHYNPVPKAIVEGGKVRCVEGFGDKLKDGEIYVVRKFDKEDNLISVVGVPGLYAARRFVYAEGDAVVEEPAKVVDINTIAPKMWVKVVNFAGVPDRWDDVVGNGKFYEVRSVDHDDQRAYLPVLGAALPWSSLELYDKRGKDVHVPVKDRPKMDLQERFKLKQGGKYHGGLTSLAYETVGGEQAFNMTGACYADFGSAYSPIRQYSKLIIGALPMQHQVKGQGKDALENFKKYAKYIMNDSPWAPCFITKDFDQGVEDGIVLNVDKTLSQVTGAAVALRQGHEYYAPIPTFLHLVDKGYSGDVAFLVSMVASKQRGNNWAPTTMGSGHQCIQSGARASKLIEFFAKGFQDYGDKSCIENEKTYEIFKAIDPLKNAHNEESLDALFDRLVEKHTEGEGWGKKVTIKSESVYAFADAIDKLIKEQQA